MADQAHPASPQSGDVKYPTTNGNSAASQTLTHYHSKVYSLLSWERPRTSATSFATIVTLIIAGRYLPLLRWALKFLYLALGITAALEVSGRVIFSRGLASSSRPRKYYTIPKDTIESVFEDLEQLADFFVIEFQRIIFAENLSYTLGAFAATLVSYWLVRFLPLWGLALVGVTTAYLGPLIYLSNKEFIDSQLDAVQDIVNTQAMHVKEMAEAQTSHASEVVKQYVDDYRGKAHVPSVKPEVPQAKSKAPEPEPSSETPLIPDVKNAEPVKVEPEPEPTLLRSDFPSAPKDELLPESPAKTGTPEPIPAL